MASAAIAIDSWKLKIFEKNLKRAGYKYDKQPGPTKELLFLRVEYDNADMADLKDVVIKSNTEAAKSKMH